MPLPIRRMSCLISIWTEFPVNTSPVSRGYIETSAGQRLYFTTLAQLNALLGELSGWLDPPGQPDQQTPPLVPPNVLAPT